MALKAGRVGVAPDQVDPYGNLRNAEHYVLPVATADTLGGVKVGTGLIMTDGVLSSDNPTPYSLPTAAADTLGGVKVGTGLTMTDGVLSSDNPTPYSLPTAAADTLGGVKVGTGLSIADGVLSASGGVEGIYYKDYALDTVAETSTGSGIYKAKTTTDILIPDYYPISVIILDSYTGYSNSFMGCGLYHWGSWTESGRNKSETYAYGIFNSGAGSGGWLARVYYVKVADSHVLS